MGLGCSLWFSVASVWFLGCTLAASVLFFILLLLLFLSSLFSCEAFIDFASGWFLPFCAFPFSQLYWHGMQMGITKELGLFSSGVSLQVFCSSLLCTAFLYDFYYFRQWLAVVGGGGVERIWGHSFGELLHFFIFLF